jgi:protein SMG6
MAERSARRQKEARELQPTDIDQKLTLLMRRTELANRAAAKERTRHTDSTPTQVPQASSSQTLISPQPRSPRPTVPLRKSNNNLHEADHDDFSRRLHISSPPPAPQQQKPTHKLFDPQAPDHPQIVMRSRTSEPEAMSEVSSSNAPRHQAQSSPRAREREASQSRQLFDYRKDDPMRFSVLARPPRPLPTPKSSGDYVSASSTSSYANSVSSSAFTLSSTTDGSSASSALFDRPNGGGSRGDEGSSVLSLQLKKLYRAITHLETKVKTEDIEDEEGTSRKESRVTLKGKQPEGAAAAEEDAEREKWNTAIENHKL